MQISFVTRLLSGGMVALSLFGAPLLADEYHAMNAGAPVWNGAIQFSSAKAAAIAATGCRAVRVNFRMDGHAAWDASLLAQYDTVLQNAANNNLKVLGLLSNECMPVGQAQYNDDPDGDGLNAYVTGYAQTALLLIDRYKAQIKRWEVWNEPNAWTNPNYASDPRYAGGTYILPRVYASLLSEVYKQLNYNGGRSILTDHGISLVSGGLFAHEIGGGFSHAMDYMQQVYARTSVWNWMQTNTGRRYPWRFFGYHFYLATDTAITTARLNQYFNAVRSGQSAAGDTSPLLITEFGWNSASAGGEAGQRNNMRIAYDHMETRPYILGAYWYQWVDEPYPYYWGVTRGDGSLKPAHAEFTAQNGDNLPPPEPQVTLAADRTQIEAGGSVRFTPTLSLFPGVTASTSNWWFGSQQQSLPGGPAAMDWTFSEPGQYDVRLLVTDNNGLSGESSPITIQVAAPAAVVGDFDGDGDVDIEDFGYIQACFTGVGIPQQNPACIDARLEGNDSDVDPDDLQRFMRCFSGPNVPAEPGCAG